MESERETRGWMADRRRLMAGAGAAWLCSVAAAKAQTAPESAHDRQLREDFPWLARYAADNDAVRASGVRPGIVFMGDSITERWQRTHPAFFSPRRICRGIGGQTTPQMLLRMMPDVIALRPRAVHIMAGTNDIAGNTGPMTLAQTRDNIEAMAMLAKAYGLVVLIGSVAPAAAFRWRPDKAPAGPIRELNAMLRQVSDRTGASWIDYYPVLATPEGAMRPDFAQDGVHPLDPGYTAMEKVLAPRLARIER